MSIVKIAWRNVWRNQRRTLITVAAMSLALTVMILYSGLVRGYMKEMESKLLNLELGDIQIFAPQYKEMPSIYKKIDEHTALLDKLHGQGFLATARLLGGGLGASNQNSAGVIFLGLEVENDAKVSQIYQHVIKGKWLDPSRPKEVVVGRRLARNLGLKEGDELMVLSQGADGSMANDIFIIRGILKGISQAADRSGVFMTAAAFRELMVFPRGVHQVIVRRPENLPLNMAKIEVDKLAPGQDVKTWRQLMPTIASMLANAKSVMMVMSLIVYISIAIVILNAMLMAVFERIRELGVLKALGMKPLSVFLMIFTESFIQVLLAVLLGLTFSLPGVWYLSTAGINLESMSGFSAHGLAWDPIWKAQFNSQTFQAPVITLVIIVCLAVIYPAIKAALIKPVKAISHQ